MEEGAGLLSGQAVHLAVRDTWQPGQTADVAVDEPSDLFPTKRDTQDVMGVTSSSRCETLGGHVRVGRRSIGRREFRESKPSETLIARVISAPLTSAVVRSCCA